MKKFAFILGLLVAVQSFCLSEAYARKEKKDKKTLVYVIGDSTVKNGQGRGDGGQWGWGSFSGEYFVNTRPKFVTGPSEAAAVALLSPKVGGTPCAIRCGKEIMSLYNSAITTGENSLQEIVPGLR